MFTDLEYDLTGLHHKYPKELNNLVPILLINNFSIKKGLATVTMVNNNFTVTMRENPPLSKKMIVTGHLKNGQIDGDYQILKEQDLVNLHFVNSELVGEPTEIQWHPKSGNAKIYKYRSQNIVVMEQYQNRKLTVRTFLDGNKKTAENFYQGKIFLTTTHDLEGYPLQTIHTANVHPNVKRGYTVSIPDNEENALVREKMTLNRPYPGISFFATKLNPVVNHYIPDSPGELLVYYTPEGVIYEMAVTYLKEGIVFKLIDAGKVDAAFLAYLSHRE